MYNPLIFSVYFYLLTFRPVSYLANIFQTNIFQRSQKYYFIPHDNLLMDMKNKYSENNVAVYEYARYFPLKMLLK